MSIQLVDTSVWLAELATRIAGAPNETLEQELSATLREFYVHSGSYILNSPPMSPVAGQDTYTLPPHPQGTFLTLLAVSIDDIPVRYVGTNTPGTFRVLIRPAISTTDNMLAAVSLRPRDYTQVPDITETYDFDTIVDGVTGRMFNMPDRPWSNAPAAPYYLRRFRIGMGQARVRVQGQYTNFDQGWRYPAWA